MNAESAVKELRDLLKQGTRCGLKTMVLLADLIESQAAEQAELQEQYNLLQANCNAQFARAEEAESLLDASQRRERAAVEDMNVMAAGLPCDVCANIGKNPCGYGQSKKCFKWRGPQEAGKGAEDE